MAAVFLVSLNLNTIMQMQTKRHICLLSAALALVGAHAHAGHPLVTEDTGTQGEGKRQIEASFDHTRQQARSSRAGSFTYSYGMSDKLDFFISQPSSLSRPSGLQDMSLGSKFRFSEDKKSSWAVQTEFLLPTGNVSKGLSTDSNDLTVTLARTATGKLWAFHQSGSVTWHRYRNSADQLTLREYVARASVAAEYALNAEWKLLGDTGFTQADRRQDRRHPVHFVLGVEYTPNSSIDLDAGVKLTRVQGYNERQVGVGLAWHF